MARVRYVYISMTILFDPHSTKQIGFCFPMREQTTSTSTQSWWYIAPLDCVKFLLHKKRRTKYGQKLYFFSGSSPAGYSLPSIANKIPPSQGQRQKKAPFFTTITQDVAVTLNFEKNSLLFLIEVLYPPMPIQGGLFQLIKVWCKKRGTRFFFKSNHTNSKILV